MTSTAELATDFVALLKDGRHDEAASAYNADEIVSYENMPGDDMGEIRGKAGVRAKGEWWGANHEIHGVEIQGPYLNGDQFAVRFRMDITPKGGARQVLDEVGVYTIREGRIAEERFYY